jgi:nitrogen PTS system EIIA component
MQLSVRDITRLFKVSEKTVYRWIRDQGLPAHRIHDSYRLNRSEVLEWATTRKIDFHSDLFQIDDDLSSDLPDLARCLERGGIHRNIAGDDKAAVLRSVVDVLALPPDVNREFLLMALLARETLGSTAIGDGIAIPHVRNPIVLQVAEPTVTLCFLAKPIDFGALDNQPVHVLFTIISTSVRSHLHILSRLSYCLNRKEVRGLLTKSAGREEILGAFGDLEKGLGTSGGT